MDRADCRNDFDRNFIEAAILYWYGSKESFTEYVRGPLRAELLGNLSKGSVLVGYALIVVTAPVAAGLELCLSLWMAGAPADVLAARFIAMVIGVDLVFCALVLQITMLLCDRMALPCCSITLSDPLKTLVVWLCFSDASFFGRHAFSGFLSRLLLHVHLGHDSRRPSLHVEPLGRDRIHSNPILLRVWSPAGYAADAGENCTAGHRLSPCIDLRGILSIESPLTIFRTGRPKDHPCTDSDKRWPPVMAAARIRLLRRRWAAFGGFPRVYRPIF